MRFVSNPVALAIAALIVAGCGQSPDTSVPGTEGSAGNTNPKPPPVASIGAPKTVAADKNAGGMLLDVSPSEAEPVKDSPEWALEEISLLRAAPISDDPALVGQLRRERNGKIIDLAAKVISETHADPGQDEYFTNAVRQLLQTRLEMALAGQPDDIEAMYDDVKNLDERDHNSAAAEEGAFTLVRYAHANAQRFAGSEPHWFQELSRQARLYADGYPSKVDRAAPILFAAARSCEINAPRMKDPTTEASLLNEAKLCYSALKSQFAEHPDGQRAVAILRRLSVHGQLLEQFSGPTLDGKYARIEQLRGKTAATVIVFWSSESEEFEKNVGALVSAVRKHKGVYMLGVNLDTDELPLKAFLANHDIPGKQIFFPAGKRGWDNPIVNYWGILEVPTVWVLDRQGVVVSTNVEISRLDDLLAKVAK